MRAGIGERDQRMRIAQYATDRGFVRVEQQRAEHGLEVLGERQVEHAVERIASRLGGERGDRALLEVRPRRLDHLYLVPFAVEQAKVLGTRDLLAHGIAERALAELVLIGVALQG